MVGPLTSSRLLRGVGTALLILAFVLQGTIGVLAGTTGSITGTVVDSSTNQPVGGARVTAASPSQTVTTTTDSSGHYTFASLNPDTYSVSVAATTNHDAYSVSGVTVLADQTQTVTLAAPRRLQQIGSVTSRAASALVKPGTTADVYSITATSQDKASQLGGGGLLNSAWSAISSVPGVYVGAQMSGYVGAGPGVSIRGGDYDQIGYEFDGVPVNRSFDNYPSSTISSLGQQELQVYTGANPANSEAQGISGYINQVIRTGTLPAYRSLNLAAGAPSLYNRVAFETGGATPSRNFSYYFGAGLYNQDFRYADQFNGASLSNLFGPPLAPCSGLAANATPANVPSCFTPNGASYANADGTQSYALGPYPVGYLHRLEVRNTVLNLHFGIPTSGGNKDDVQALLDIDHASSAGYFSTNDMGGPDYMNTIGFGTPFYGDAYQFNNALGTPIPSNYQALTTPYLFPLSPTGRAFQSNIPFDASDTFVNNQSIAKLQYQKNFGTKAFLRLYGYTYYSDWLNNGPQGLLSNYIAFDVPDYELSSHAKGVSLEYSNQITPQHLLTLQGSYTTASSIRDNNTQMVNGLFGPNSVNARTVIGAVVNAGNPLAGYCFTPAGAVASCALVRPSTPGAAQFATIGQAANGTIAPLPAACPLAGSSTNACEYLTVGNGLYATYNTVTPRFWAASFTDNWKPTDRLSLNLGVRLDSFRFDRADTFNSDARTFWYNAFNLDNCISTTTGNLIPRAPGAACPAGSVASFVSNPPAPTITYNNWQPRVGLTYTVDPSTVVRASYGRYVQAPNAAFQQYDALQANAPALLYGTYSFQKFGFTTPNHDVFPPASNNYDLSIEKSLPGQWSLKLTPFLRQTQGQIQQFYLNQQTNFVSGLNVGRQTSEGVEFEIDKGDFARNGVSGRLSLTYTNSFIKYTQFPNGGSVIDPINQAIKNYNAYTSFCASNPADPRCAGGATASGNAAGPCFTPYNAATSTFGTGVACAAGTIANPYWNAPAQALFDPNANYATYDIFPGGVVSAAQAYGAPYLATLIVQYKHNKLAITPALQFIGGIKYGAPEAMAGVAPEGCAAGGTAVDPNRYPYGAPGGTGYDYATCANGAYGVVVPDNLTGHFDNLGAFRQPNELMLHTQISYDVTPRLTLVGTFSNIINTCWGGSKVPWSFSGSCGYSLLPGAGSGPQPIANNYNPGDAIQPLLAVPYTPYFAATPATSPASPGIPFQVFVEARLKI
jgi:hypothetical protein